MGGKYLYNHFDGNAPAGASVSGAMADVKAAYHTDVTLPKSKLKCKGYVLAGWSTEKAAVNEKPEYNDQGLVLNLVEPQDNNDGKVTLYAVWRNEFEIAYHTDGGTLDGDDDISSYQYGKAKSLPVPTKAGYTFDGWFLDNGLKKKIASITKTTQGDLDLYAKWAANGYKIKFDGNGSNAGKMANQTMKYGEEKALPANKFVKYGYVFTGWKTEGGKYSYDDGALFTDFVPAKNNGTITLVAQWSPTKYQISYELDGGEFTDGAKVPENYSYGETITLPDTKTVVRDGYTFAGWYTDCNYKKKLTGVTAKTVGDLTLYAKWTANYKILFHAGDTVATGSMASQAMKYETAKGISKNKFALKKEVDGVMRKYGFSGWALEECGEVLYKDGEKILRPEALEKAADGELVLNLYAVWDSDYTVTLFYPGAVLEDMDDRTSFEYQYGVGVTKTELAKWVPVRDGYTFAGWYSDPACKKKVTSISTKQTGNMILYAKWTGVKYTVSFSANAAGVTGKMRNQRLVFGTPKALNKCSFKRAGYTFKGWSTTADGEVAYHNQEKFAGPDSLGENNTAVLYAVWEKDTYSISYRNVSESVAAGYPVSYQVDTDTIVLEEPERMGYTFLGWYTDAACRKKITEIKKGSTGDLTLYAKWKVN